MNHTERIAFVKLLCILSIVLVIQLMEIVAVPLLILIFAIIIMPWERRNLLRQTILPVVFLVIACMIPYVYLYIPNPVIEYPPPPGYTTQWWYYLIGDFDYFFRLRFIEYSIPFWIATGIILFQMNVPYLDSRFYDLVLHLVIGALLTLSWWLLAVWIFTGVTSWTIVPILLTPLIGMAVDLVHRVLNWESEVAEREVVPRE